ncbi:MAG: Gfo/Idh/MocA family oxidoreductase [Clostridia bacterium]|nr:Gfo/Idh/MocA family oxidoreductase [Clostridia bacterium]
MRQRFKGSGKPLADGQFIVYHQHLTLQEVGAEFGIPEDLRFTNLDDMLACERLDAVHIVTPIHEHAPQVLKVLNAGKHAACTVPMATTVEECRAIVEASERNGKYYMMMETAVYTREYLYVKDLLESGKLGRIQFVRASHMQNMGMEGWPEYWLGLPPFHYGTHAVAPLSCILDKDIDAVTCHGSGRVQPVLVEKYGSPFAVETCTLTFGGSDVCAETTRSLFDTVRQYRESFDIYGDKMAYEWDQIEDEGACLFEGGESARRIHAPDALAELPESIRPFTRREQITDVNHVSFIQGAGHGGSHPHLVHEFVSAIVEGRQPAVNAVRSANITCAGILAHESAMKGGVRMELPDFTKRG